MSVLTKVILHLGRNPNHPEGDRHQGYIIDAPLGANGKLDSEIWRAHAKDCKVVKFNTHEGHNSEGLLTHNRDKWYFTYKNRDDGNDEDLFHLGDHRLWVGDYVTIHDNDDESLVYVVAS